MAGAKIEEAILSAQRVSKSFGAQPILKDISLTVHEGERVGLTGRNGSGKSTLLKILAGREEPDAGIVTQRRMLRLGMLEQECALDPTRTIGDVLEEGCRQVRALFDEHERLVNQMADPATPTDTMNLLQERYSDLHHEIELIGGWDYSKEIKRVATALALPEPDRVLKTLSGGELRRVDLAATLLGHPDILLLDEPTNHIDTKSIEWMESFLVGYEGSCILVTHDRYFLDLVVSRIVEIEFNRLYSFPGSYERFLEYKASVNETEERTEISRQAILRRELAWLKRGAKARTTKQKARVQRVEKLNAQEGPLVHKDVLFEIPEPARLGKRILEADMAQYGYGSRTLFERLTLIMQAGMRVGIVGPNGSGKTTLLRVLMGQEPVRKGRITIGDTTQFLYVDQTHEEVKPNQTILDFVSNGTIFWELDGRRLHMPSYLERFLYDRNSANMPMRNLSGGERNRIILAKKLLKGGNFLVLDEPTNDLDLPTLRVLEESILAFDGCALIVSHDRYFLNRLCTHLIVFEEGKAELVVIAGNYDDYLLYKEKQTAATTELRKEDSRPQPNGKPDKTTTANPQRLTYKEKQELAGMEKAIETAEKQVACLEEMLAAPGFYQQEYSFIQKGLDELAEAKKNTELLYARWQELSERTEA